LEGLQVRLVPRLALLDGEGRFVAAGSTAAVVTQAVQRLKEAQDRPHSQVQEGVSEKIGLNQDR
ncbi:MAG TPA: hypothetical protein VF184_11985, partial [Phycisphaeraceae bacterium]